MQYPRFSLVHVNSLVSSRTVFVKKMIITSCCLLIVCLLSACSGSSAASIQPVPHPTATATSTPTPSPTPTPKPTPKPTAKPTSSPPPPAPAPTQPPPPPPPPAPTQPPPPAPTGPDFLNVTPSSMSIVGHFDCSRTATAFFCQSAVIAFGSNPSTLHWVAFDNIGNVGFSPSAGFLAPGARVILSIRIPVSECSDTFFFKGPNNTHTIGWSC